jgi:hypothetical protein
MKAAIEKTLKGTFYLTLLALFLLVVPPASAIVCGCFCEGLVPSRPCSDPFDPSVHNCGDWLYFNGYTCTQSAAVLPSPASPPSFLALDSQAPVRCTASPAVDAAGLQP